MNRAVLVAVVLAATAAHAEEATTTPAPAPAIDPVLGGAEAIGGDEAPGVVAFTFDDGPHVGTTEQVMEALQQYDVPATFFVVGNRLVGKSKAAEGRRALIGKMVELGFEVGNHSWDHPNLARLNAAKVAYQIDHTNEKISALTGKPVALYRAPYGSHGKHSIAHASKVGLTTVDWSIDSLDWRKPKADRMRKAIVDGIFKENGGVVLMHDTKKLTARTIGGILDDLEARNCARLATGEAPIVPVSLHYFLEDNGADRKLPAEVEARTQRYRDALPGRCEARPKAEGEQVTAKK